MVRFSVFVSFLFVFQISRAQRVVPAQEAVNLVLANSRNVQAAQLFVQQQQQLIRGAFSIPNLEVFVESPTGTFYTPSFLQSFDFPSVYSRQRQLLTQEATLAAKEAQVTSYDIKYQVRLLYLSLQYTDSLLRLLTDQDSLYQNLARSAKRQFDAGQIDYLQTVYAEAQAGEVRNLFLQTEASRNSYRSQLRYLFGNEAEFASELLRPDDIDVSLFTPLTDTTAVSKAPAFQVALQNEQVSLKNIQLQKSRALPGFGVGYFNQGERNTPISQRFRAGITIPIYFWQYKSNINAAKIQYQVAQQRSKGVSQQLTAQLVEARNLYLSYARSLQYYQTTGLAQANAIITTANRLFSSGETDLISLLRSVNDANVIKQRSIEAIRNYNQAVITIQYLTGNL